MPNTARMQAAEISSSAGRFERVEFQGWEPRGTRGRVQPHINLLLTIDETPLRGSLSGEKIRRDAPLLLGGETYTRTSAISAPVAKLQGRSPL